MKVSIDFIRGYTNGDRTVNSILCHDVQGTVIENGIYYIVYSDGITTSMFPIHNIAKITESKG